MIENFKAEIKNLSIRDYFLSGFDTFTCITQTTLQTLGIMQQNLLLTGKPFKMGIAGYFVFNNVASYTHPFISEFTAIPGFSSPVNQRCFSLYSDYTKACYCITMTWLKE